MTDQLSPPPADDGEALSAYLAGELGDAEARALEARLTAEPALAAQLDALAEALVTLGGFDEADVPAGYDERLEARLAAERGATQTAGEETAALPPPVDLAERRRNRQGTWLGIGTAAAVLALGAVMFSGLVRSGGMGASDESAEMAAGGSESALEESAVEDGAATGGGAGAGMDFSGPVVRDRQTAVADEAALQQRFSTTAEAQGLLGVPVQEARRLQKRYTTAVRDELFREPVASEQLKSQQRPATGSDDAAPEAGAPPGDREEDTAVSGGAASAPDSAAAPPRVRLYSIPGADRCLATIMRGQSPLVPVRVESLRYQGRPAIAYLFVGASPGSGALDRAELWVVRPENCATVVFQEY